MQCSYADKQNNLTHKVERDKHFCFHYVRTSSGRKGKRFSFPMYEKLSKDYFPLFVFCTFETNFVGVQIDKRLENSNISITIIFQSFFYYCRILNHSSFSTFAKIQSHITMQYMLQVHTAYFYCNMLRISNEDTRTVLYLYLTCKDPIVLILL